MLGLITSRIFLIKEDPMPAALGGPQPQGENPEEIDERFNLLSLFVAWIATEWRVLAF